MVTLAFNYNTKVWDDVSKHRDESLPTIELDETVHKTGTITLPDFLIPKLERAKKDIRNDLDVVVLTTGAVGSGKSTLARAMCRYMSNDRFMPRKHLIKDVNDFERVIKTAPTTGGVVQIDEASGIYGSTDTLSKKTKFANLVLDVCRGQNLFIVVCAPYFHKLGTTLATDRSCFLLRTYIDKRTGKKGKVAYYKRALKDKMYPLLKKGEPLAKFKPTFRGTFGADYMHEEEYQEIKKETLNSVLDSWSGKKQKDNKTTPQDAVEKYRLELVKKNINEPVKKTCELLGLSQRQMIRLRNKAKEELALENELYERKLRDFEMTRAPESNINLSYDSRLEDGQ